jgi:hypothetical protein
MGFVHLQAKCVGSQSDTQTAFCNVSKGECYYRVKKKHFRENLILAELLSKKHFRENLILPKLLSDNLANVPEDIFQ